MLVKKWLKKIAEESGKKLSTVQSLIPAICLGVLVVAALSQYHPPKTETSEVEAADLSALLNILAQEQSTQTKEDAGKGAFDLEDGVYQGSGTGYGGTITVDVTVNQKTMTAIDVVSAQGETESFFNRAKAVIDSMLSQQTTEVDVVSGATYSSNGIIAAVENALYGTESTAQTAAAQQTDAAPDIGEVDDADATYKDGTYTGSAQGYGGSIKVEVTIKNGKISKITVLDASGETASYFAKAKTLINAIIKKQSTNVDAVSGATYSSNGIIKAVRNALSKAKTTAPKKTKASKKKKSSKKNNTSDEKTDNTKNSSGINVSDGTYKDGTYTGTASIVDTTDDKFNYTLEISVTIKDGKIVCAEYTDSFKNSDAYGMNAQWLDTAEQLFSAIVSGNSTNVDVITGATYSSKGIIAAINQALDKARQSSSGASSETEPETTAKKEETTTATEDNPQEETTQEEGVLYKNGTYPVSVQCSPDENNDFTEYTMEMNVVISNDKITAVNDIRGTTGNKATNNWYINKAASEVGKKIAEKGDVEEIDAYTGATCSSIAVMEGCKKALEEAKK